MGRRTAIGAAIERLDGATLAARRGVLSHAGLCLTLGATIVVYATVVQHGAVYEDAAWLGRPMHASLDLLNLALWSFLAQGQDVAALHLGNLLIHLLNGVLVYVLASRLLETRWVALLAAFIFLLHPLQREAVNYISGRPDLISTMLVLAAVCLATVKRTSIHLVMPVLLLALLALTTKPSAIMALPLALLTLLILRPDCEAIVRAALWVWIGLIALLMTVATPIVYETFLRPPLIDLLTFAGHQAVALLRLLLLVVVPIGFSVDHDYAWVTLTTGLLALGVLGVGLRWCWGQRRATPVLAWAGLWVIVALAPRFITRGAYELPPEINEHQAYLAMPGVAIGLASVMKGWL